MAWWFVCNRLLLARSSDRVSEMLLRRGFQKGKSAANTQISLAARPHKEDLALRPKLKTVTFYHFYFYHNRTRPV
jgi:hypothetical protein